ncbi:DUF4430 domain-containing protein [Enterococcus sp. BWR-S5]|uniref:DUF4430 domain-containing protein n=1 Tax=Enterococcus sp. BWR-S5 TaxID=2787714 RepID=UPI00192409D6|nr:DUF4430 domain-containing protein [Enterococcus sp. BWR-S5]MBL1225930.1 DUF4430 domain-containing protein [Enterococcus sp. BWR-S5]
MRKAIYASSVLVLTVVFISGCSSAENTSGTSDKRSANEIEVTVSLMKDDAEVTKKEITTAEDTTLMEAMKENFELEEDNGMITSIDGIEQDEAENRYWVYTINGEMINTGAKDTTLKQGDQVEFTYEKF